MPEAHITSEEIANELEYWRSFARQRGENVAWEAAVDAIVQLRRHLKRLADVTGFDPDRDRGTVVDHVIARLEEARRTILSLRVALTSCAGCWTAPDCPDCPIPALLETVTRNRRKGSPQ